MNGTEVRTRFLEFFKKRGHTIIPSAPLVPLNDPTVLFNTAGMQPLVPYLMGQPHPSGATRIVDAQKCVRTNDIDEVGDNTHLTFFEMLGNWSLGDYFKKSAIEWSFEFLTSEHEGLGLDVNRLYVTVFEGNDDAPRDEEAYQIWKNIFECHNLDPDRRIFFMDAASNWWSPGENGPCGPDSEMFYDVTGTLTNGMTREEFIAADDAQHVVEIWNDVFMEYEKKDGVVIGKLTSKNVDTGSGLERITTVVQGKEDVFATDLFIPITDAIKNMSQSHDGRAIRVIADHVKCATFLLSEGVSVSNTDQGYILRRLIRRAVRFADTLQLPEGALKTLVNPVIAIYEDTYPELATSREAITTALEAEELQFRKTLRNGIKRFEELVARDALSGEDAFTLFTTYGFPFELTEELARERGITIDRAAFEAKMEDHRALSRSSSAGKFKGGLADSSDRAVQYHTITHLLLAALQQELGKHVHQAGSNITAERLRFDVTHKEKIDRETLDKIEAWVNTAIKNGGMVTVETKDKSDAERDQTIEGSFWDKYPDTVYVYTITAPDGTILSRELCGGPHVSNLRDITGTFSIKKEESSSAGIRRIKAELI